MKKSIKYLVIFCLFFLPFFVEAKKNYLYDVMKDDLESGAVKEYTGEHEDSLTIPADSKIYHWRGSADLIKTKNNVIFAGFCWQIVRTTDTGGVKLLYNGIPDSSGACSSSRYTHKGLSYVSVYLGGSSYYYSSSYRYDESTGYYYLTGQTKYLTYSANNFDSVKGWYTCKNTNSEGKCTTLYLIDGHNASTSFTLAFALGDSAPYSAIGWSLFNPLYNSIADLSYTYNKRYPGAFEYLTTSMSISQDREYTVGDYYTKSGNRYNLYGLQRITGAEWAENYQNYVGKYTCDGGSGGATSMSCVKIGYITDYSNKYNMIKTDANLNYIYGDEYVYDSTTGKYTVSGNTVTIQNYHLEQEQRIGKRYTCHNTSGVCDQLRFVYGSDISRNDEYIVLSNGESEKDAYAQMTQGDDNPQDSSVKKLVDMWYEENLLDYSRYIEDSIYCLDRLDVNDNAFNSDSGSGGPNFTRDYNNRKMTCSRIEDKYSVSNEKAKLKYPIGLLTFDEAYLNSGYFMYENAAYWLMTPGYLAICNNISANGYVVQSNAPILAGCSTTVNNKNAVRPTITLVKGVKYDGGDGTQTAPYLIASFVKSNIIVENDDNKGTFETDSLENIEEGSRVSFSIQPKKGYGIDSVVIKDSEENIIDYQSNDNEYSFVMPDSDTTITIEYKKLKYEVSVQIVNETKDYTINITDLTQVEYEEEVIFKATPIKGFQIKSIKVIDTDNKEIEFTETDNEYKFIMPASNVTIIPIYEKVKNPIVIEENIDDSFVTVEVANIRAVVYEDKVLFQVDPTEGYVLARILISDADGNPIEYTKKENENVFEFIMPDKEIIISLSYEKEVEEVEEPEKEQEQPEEEENPNTQDIVLVVLIILLISYISTKWLQKHLANS